MVKAGQRVGEFVLIDRIGGGAFGDVWRARHHAWNEEIVAVKIPTDPQYLQCLQREGVAIRKLAHPNIVRAIAFDPFADPAYLAMEYVPGANLRQRMQQRPLPLEEALGIIRQVLTALHVAHGQKIVHRDIKPENILLAPAAGKQGQKFIVKLADFGLGNALTRDAQSILMSHDANDAAALIGTQAYMAPDHAETDSNDPRADLFACGVVLFEMITGHRPVGLERPSDFNREVPAWLDRAFQASYARLDRRVPSAQAFLQMLQTEPPPVVKPMSFPPPLPPRPVVAVDQPLVIPVNTSGDRRRVAFWVISAVVVMGLVIVILSLYVSDIANSKNASAIPAPAAAPPSPQAYVVPQVATSRRPPKVSTSPAEPSTPPLRVPLGIDFKPGRAMESGEVFERARTGYPELFSSIKRAELVAFHDASRMRRNAGGRAKVPGAYSGSPMAGRTDVIMLWGAYEALTPGRYLIVYRAQALSQISGENICFLDVCTDGNTIASRRPPAGEFIKNGWKEFPVELDLKNGTTVEYRLWPNNNTIALDRIYVFKVE